MIAKYLKALPCVVGLASLMSADGKLIDNSITVKKGPFTQVEYFQAKGNFGDVLPLYKTETMEVKFECINSVWDDDPAYHATAITMFITNPYDHDLQAFYLVESRRPEVWDSLWVDDDNHVGYRTYTVAPGQTIDIGELIGVYTFDDSYWNVGSAWWSGTFYLSDGSYYSLFGEQTSAMNVRMKGDAAFDSFYDAFGDYECVVAGPVLAAVPHGGTFHISKSVDQKTKEEQSLMEHSLQKDAKFQKHLKQQEKILKNLEAKSQLDNYVEMRVGSKDPIDYFEVKGNFGQKLTLFESNVIEASFKCEKPGVVDDDIGFTGIEITVHNPYDFDLHIGTNLEISEDDDSLVILRPGETRDLGAIIGTRLTDKFGWDDDYWIQFDNAGFYVGPSQGSGVVYASDGSYFGILGDYTVQIVDWQQYSTINIEHDCIIAGPFIGLTNYKDTLKVTKNANMVKDLRLSEKLKHDNVFFEKYMQKYSAKYEHSVDQQPSNEPFVNYYHGKDFGTYVFEAAANNGDSVTIVETDVIRVEFECNGNQAEINYHLYNPYDTPLWFQTQGWAAGNNWLADVPPGDTFTVNAWNSFASSNPQGDAGSVDDSMRSYIGSVWLSDGTSFMTFNAQDMFILENDGDFQSHDCFVTGPYMLALPSGQTLKNSYHGPVGKSSMKTNKLFARKHSLSDDKWTKSLNKLKKSNMKSNHW